MTLNPALGPIIAKALLVVFFHSGTTKPPPLGWNQLDSDLLLLDRHAAHCRPHQCRAIVMRFLGDGTGYGIVIDPNGQQACRFHAALSAGPSCALVSGCGLSASACSADARERR